MQETAQELQQILNDFSEKFKAIDASSFSAKPLPHQWSKKEVVGHLIDSAHNNLRRFVVGQYDEMPPTIVYDQNFWVTSNAYQDSPQQDVITLWKLINERICTVLTMMPSSHYTRQVNTGKDKESLHTLEWLAQDYVKHMKHHINQIIPGSFDITYS
jgi:hypothetical protein